MKQQMPATYFFEKYFSIHGEFNGTIHRTKRNQKAELLHALYITHRKAEVSRRDCILVTRSRSIIPD
jgi:hypothetical protein